MHLNLSRRAMALLALIILAVAVPLTIYLVRQQQDIRQRAAGESDLVITGFQLVDAGGNVRTTFGVNEEIYLGKAYLKEGDSYRSVAFFSLRKSS